MEVRFAFWRMWEHDGSIRTMGVARTEFRGRVALSGGLTIDGQLPKGTDIEEVVFPLWKDSFGGVDPEGDPLEATGVGDLYDDLLDLPLFSVGEVDTVKALLVLESACNADTRPGVHLYETSSIGGDLYVRNIRRQSRQTWTEDGDSPKYAFDPCTRDFLYTTVLWVASGPRR